ncbi:MAG: protein-glutamate O-methyltransferase CheR [Candidatus Dadabacteria bacterium]|nr:MAG: protein-glutamate O-methyltransferase CheR [Candidatus Dadabacteria bacterium]
MRSQELEAPQLRRILRESAGIECRHMTDRALLRAAERAGARLGASRGDALRRLNEEDADAVAALAQEVLVGETFFFRDSRLWELLRRQVLPDLLRSQGSVRIWSAGCSTGEEPYSLALMIREHFPTAADRVTILATDVREEALDRAERAIWRDWSFRGVPEEIRRRHFTAIAPGLWGLSTDVRQMIRFAKLDLLSDDWSALGDSAVRFDLILCRNVLIYFHEAAAAKVCERMAERLAEKGLLAVAPADTVLVPRPTLAVVSRVYPAVYGRSNEAALGRSNPTRPRGSQTDVERRAAAGAERPLSTQVSAKPAVSRTIATDRGLAAAERAAADPGNVTFDPDRLWLDAARAVADGEDQRAEMLLRQVVYLDPGHLGAEFLLARLAAKQGDRRAERLHLEQALRLAIWYDADFRPPGCEGETAGSMRKMLQEVLRRLEGE